MKSSKLVALLFGFTASALSEFVALDFNVLRGGVDKRERNKDQPRLVQRASKGNGLALITLSNQKTFYVATLKIGSNKDAVEVEVDTLSSDLWVVADNANCTGIVGYFANPYNASQTDLINCTAYGTFNPKNSNSYKDNHTTFDAYNDSLILGSWGTDTVVFGNFSIPDYIFAVVDTTTTRSGVLGLGPQDSEVSSLASLGKIQYENFPLRLKSEGIINKAVFSLYLSDQDTGSVLFGAVDNAKYSGTLTTVPILVSNDGSNTTFLYTIMVHNISSSGNGNDITISNTPQPALLNTGATMSYFPDDIFDNLVALVGGQFSDDIKSYIIPCYPSSNTTTFNINFSGATVQIPISALVMKSDSTDQCYLGAYRVTGVPISLGNNILRSLYVVFDLDANQVSVAQAKYSNSTDIQVVSSTVPRAVSATLYSSTSFTLLETSSKHSSGVKVESGLMFLISLLAGILIP